MVPSWISTACQVKVICSSRENCLLNSCNVVAQSAHHSLWQLTWQWHFSLHTDFLSSSRVREENISHPCAQRTLHLFCVVSHSCMVAVPCLYPHNPFRMLRCPWRVMITYKIFVGEVCKNMKPLWGVFESTHTCFFHVFSSVPQHTHQTHTTTTTTHTTRHNTQQHAKTSRERDRERRQTERQRKRDKRRRDKTRRQEKMKEERQDKTRQEKRREKREDERQGKRRERREIKDKRREDKRQEKREDKKRKEARQEKREDKKREEARQEKREDER